MREIQEELDLVNGDIRTLQKAVKRPDKPIDVSKLKTIKPPERQPEPARGHSFEAPEQVAPPPYQSESTPVEPQDQSAGDRQAPKLTGKRSVYDDRFADYLASSFEAQSLRPLKHERDVQKKKAIWMVIILVAVILWVIGAVYGRAAGG